GLEEFLTRTDRLATWETAVLYHLVHAVALLALALAGTETPGAGARRWTSRLWITGVVIFSGSLYLLCLTGQTWLGAITPLGGVALLAGWGVVGTAAWRRG
ncbi:MAG: DUF423 domain-containing protein, partial [Opitutales bacterium]